MIQKTKKSRTIAGYSFVALMKQSLRDGRVHASGEIASFVRRYIGHSGSPKAFEQGTIVPLLQTRKCFERVSTLGYRLGPGNPENDIALKLLLKQHKAMTINELSRAIARNASGAQPIPIEAETDDLGDENEMIPALNLDLDNDGRFVDYHDQGRIFWYANHLLNVNDYVRELIRRYGPITETEVFSMLRREYRILESQAIFLPETDSSIIRKGRRYVFASESAEEVIVLSRDDYEPILYFLRDDGRAHSLSTLTTYFFNKPATQTDLQTILERDPSLLKQGSFYRWERPMTIPEPDTNRIKTVIDKAVKLIRPSKIPLPSHLIIKSVLPNNLSDMSSIHVEILERAHRVLPLVRSDLGISSLSKLDEQLIKDNKEAERLKRARLSPLVEESRQEQFTKDYGTAGWKDEDESRIEREVDGQAMVLRLILTYNEQCSGSLFIDEVIDAILPQNSIPTLLTVYDADRGILFDILADRSSGVIRGFKKYFETHCPQSGAVFYLERNQDDPFKLNISYKTSDLDPLSHISREKIHSLEPLVEQAHQENLSIFEIIWLLFASRNVYEPAHRNSIWAELNVIRKASRREVAALLEAYSCFLQKPEYKGFGLYYLDPTVIPELKSL